jgi:hypothetical protein
MAVDAVYGIALLALRRPAAPMGALSAAGIFAGCIDSSNQLPC